MYGRKEGGLKGWEVGENYATMLNVPQSNKGYRVETKKKRGGAGSAKYEILEDSHLGGGGGGGGEFPPPPPTDPLRLPHAPALPFILGDFSYNFFFLFGRPILFPSL